MVKLVFKLLLNLSNKIYLINLSKSALSYSFIEIFPYLQLHAHYYFSETLHLPGEQNILLKFIRVEKCQYFIVIAKIECLLNGRRNTFNILVLRRSMYMWQSLIGQTGVTLGMQVIHNLCIDSVVSVLRQCLHIFSSPLQFSISSLYCFITLKEFLLMNI